MSFNEIREQMEKEMEIKNTSTSGVTTGSGTIVSKPGTEKIALDASSFQFMECESSAQGVDKHRFCIVEKGVLAKYPNQFINSTGDRVHIVTREVYNLMLGVINNVSKQLRSLSSDLSVAKEKADLYKMTIDALRKNGIIE